MKTRKELIQKRKQIPDRQVKDFQIACGLLPFFKAGMSAGLYIPYGAEADVWQFYNKSHTDQQIKDRERSKKQKRKKKEETPEHPENSEEIFSESRLPKTKLSLKQLADAVEDLDLHLAAPKVTGDESMAFFEARDLEPGILGILEPAGKEGGQEEVIPEVLIIPMLAFWNGYRKGYGKGYYDRYLKKHPECFRIGIAYDEQEEVFDIQPWDQRLDVLVTPDRILTFARNGRKGELLKDD